MEVLFNKSNNGQAEITDLLGFLSDDFDYDRLETDIELNTPDLINFISKEVYDKIVEYYKKDSPVDAEKSKFSRVLELCQLYISVMAYYDYSANNDLMHTSAGRKMNKSTDETTPWDWQIASDNAALKKRAYKALDQLINALDESKLDEWLASDAYKSSKALFVYNVTVFHKCYPINNSAQLYFRLVPFMDDFELDEIHPRINDELFTRLKNSIVPSSGFTPLSIPEKRLLKCIELSVVYLTLAKGYKVFPIEMFPDKINYRENTKMKSSARAEVMQFLQSEAEKNLLKVESIVNKLSVTNETSYSPQELLPGLDENNKYVDL